VAAFDSRDELMRFSTTRLNGVRLIEMDRISDQRGFFARTFCQREFSEAGLATEYVQHSSSFTVHAGTLRGMHFQRAPHEEVKVVRCLTGAIHDVLIDLRPSSTTFMQWEAFELTASNGRQLYVPPGLAHGFQTLQPETSVGYMMTVFHAPAAAAGVRYDDPAFGIRWPLPLAGISERDQAWADFNPEQWVR
jgi:dTDP-4-dehydrorhamnose 3,5-epimerase